MKTTALKQWAMACVTVVAFTINASAWKIISREASNGGLFGYKDVSWKMVLYPCDNGEVKCRGAEVKCCDPGWHHCPKSTVGMAVDPLPGESPDATDLSKSDDLMAYALSKIGTGTLRGTHLITVSVVAPDGSSTFRRYLVKWKAGKEDGDDSLIEVFRDDVKTFTPTE